MINSPFKVSLFIKGTHGEAEFLISGQAEFIPFAIKR